MEVDKPDHFIALFGLHDENLKLLRDELGVEIFAHGSEITITGEEEAQLCRTVLGGYEG